jgi:outer membrane receptor protein involved in Fe transport
MYGAEVNQIFQNERHTLVLGARLQDGEFRTRSLMTNIQPAVLAPYFLDPPDDRRVETDFNRATAYGYYTIKPVENLWLTVGLAYDHVVIPLNHRAPPVSAEDDTRHQLSPKAALVWSPQPEVTFRGMFSRSLGGVSIDDYLRLEPTQLAGFIQTYRTVISESIAGSVSAPAYDVAGAAVDLKFATRTYVSLQAQFLKSEVADELGVFAAPTNVPPPLMSVFPAGTSRQLEYEEPSAALTVNQLLSDSWSVGAQYRYTRSTLQTVFPALVPVAATFDTTERADLQQATLFALWNHSSGFFARFESLWYHQENHGYTPALPGDDFFQHNVLVGYRLKRQRGELTLGVLNLTDTDYRLNPLNPYSELPRERVFLARLKFNF